MGNEMVDPVTVGAIASAAKPETLQAAGGLLESTGKGVGTIFHSVGTIGTEHHQISADTSVKELEILSQMDADQLTALAAYKKATQNNGGRKFLRVPWIYVPSDGALHDDGRHTGHERMKAKAPS